MTSAFRCITTTICSARIVNLLRTLVMANLPGLTTSFWTGYMALLYLEFEMIRRFDLISIST
jgi:hypothetical protein